MPQPTPFGPWLLLERLAVGGMAEVHLALRCGERPPRLYALKRMLPTLAHDPEPVTLFLDEARVWAQLAHPSILPLRGLGREEGVHYFTYDYLPGKDLGALQARLHARGALLPVGLAVHLAAQVADALDHAHRRRGRRGESLGVVHNDVSPANLLLGFDGAVRVIDFGIARAAPRNRAGAVVLRALARRPAQRFAWASELREALLPHAAERGQAALARLLARTFPEDLRAERARLEGLRGAGRAASAAEAAGPTRSRAPGRG